MLVHDVVSDEIQEVIEFCLHCEEAERMLASCLADKPGWEHVLRVERFEFPEPSPN